YGVSFLVAAVNGLVADGFFALRDGGWAPTALRTRRLGASAARVAAGFGLAGAYGGARLSRGSEGDGPYVAGLPACTPPHPGGHLAQVLVTQEQVPPGVADLVVWPENAVMDNVNREGMYLDDVGWLARTKRAMFLLGGMTWPASQPGKTMNGALLVNTEGKIV